MDRRHFLATLGGGGAAVLATGFLADPTGGGPDYGSIPLPAGSGSMTLPNGRQAERFAGGRVACFGAALVSQYSGVPAVVGRVRNVSGGSLTRIRVELRFLDAADAVLAGGWVDSPALADGAAWQFVANYPNDDPDRIATAAVTGFEAVENG